MAEERSLVLNSAVVQAHFSRLFSGLVERERTLGVLPSITGLCEACSLQDVKIARMGGDLVMLSFRSLETGQTAFTATKEYEMQFSKTFFSLDQWQPGKFQASRRDWLDIKGPSAQLEKRRHQGGCGR